MNREIKFKAKRKDNGEWVYGYLVKEKRDIRTSIFKNIHLTESEKEKVWEQIVS